MSADAIAEWADETGCASMFRHETPSGQPYRRGRFIVNVKSRLCHVMRDKSRRQRAERSFERRRLVIRSAVDGTLGSRRSPTVGGRRLLKQLRFHPSGVAPHEEQDRRGKQQACDHVGESGSRNRRAQSVTLGQVTD